eukprot:945099-Rhodomonas_salina.1
MRCPKLTELACFPSSAEVTREPPQGHAAEDGGSTRVSRRCPVLTYRMRLLARHKVRGTDPDHTMLRAEHASVGASVSTSYERGGSTLGSPKGGVLPPFMAAALAAIYGCSACMHFGLQCACCRIWTLCLLLFMEAVLP